MSEPQSRGTSQNSLPAALPASPEPLHAATRPTPRTTTVLDTQRHPHPSATAARPDAPGSGPSCAVHSLAQIFIGLGLGVLLSACVNGVVPQKPDLAMPPAYDVEAQQALPPAELDHWWLLYGDAQLTALIERAQAQGLDTRNALAKLEEAQAVRASALPLFNPDRNLEASAEVRETEELEDDDGGTVVPVGGSTTVIGANRTRTASLTFPVSWEMDLFGRRAAVRRQSDADLAAARFEFEGARATLVADVARSLFQARGLSVQLEDARANARIQRELADLLTRRVERGLAAASEVDRIAADLSQADAQALNLESELKAARRSLLVLLGDGLAPVSELDVTADIGTVPAIPNTLPGDLLARRPDVRQADARLRASAGSVDRKSVV